MNSHCICAWNCITEPALEVWTQAENARLWSSRDHWALLQASFKGYKGTRGHLWTPQFLTNVRWVNTTWFWAATTLRVRPTRVTCDATNAAGDDGCYETRKQIKASVRSDLPRNFGTEWKYRNIKQKRLIVFTRVKNLKWCSNHVPYRDRPKSAHQVWWILLLL